MVRGTAQLLEAGQGLVSIESIAGADGRPDLAVRLERSLINTVGRETIRKFLMKLQTYKTLGDVDAGSTMWVYLSTARNQQAWFPAEARRAGAQPAWASTDAHFFLLDLDIKVQFVLSRSRRDAPLP